MSPVDSFETNYKRIISYNIDDLKNLQHSCVLKLCEKIMLCFNYWVRKLVMYVLHAQNKSCSLNKTICFHV